MLEGTDTTFTANVARLEQKLLGMLRSMGERRDEDLAEIHENDFTMGELRAVHQILMRFR